VSFADRSRLRRGKPGSEAATAPTAQQQPDRSRVTVERVDTEPLTVHQHRDAVAALAALIDRWTRPGENTNQGDVHGEDANSGDAPRLDVFRPEAA
jgi:hypothetical protein